MRFAWLAMLVLMGTASAADTQERFVGRWFGVRPQVSGQFHSRDIVDIEIRRAADGGLELINHDPSATGSEPVKLALDGPDRIVGRWQAMFGAMMFSGRLSAADSMDAAMGGQGFDAKSTSPVVLKRDDPAAARYRAPRLGTSGDRELSYKYTPPAPSPDWPVATSASENIDRSTIEAMVAAILRQQAEPLVNRTDAVLVVRHGKLVLEEYFWGHDRAVPHAISSDTKSVAAMIGGLAFDRGRMKPEDPVAGYFADYGDTAWVSHKYPVTVGQLLSMQAGLAWNETLPYQDAGNTAVGLILADDPIRYVLNRPLATSPGERYDYNSGLPTLLGSIIERAVGERLDVFADRHLFEPLGIRNYRWSRLTNGQILASGGIAMRPIDTAKLGQLMLDQGEWRGRRILSERWVRLSTTQQTRPADYSYGYYWHLSDDAHPRLGKHSGFMAIGQGGQYLVVVPELALVVVVSSSNWQPGGTKFALDEIINRYVIPAVR